MPNWEGYFAARAEMPAPLRGTQGYGYQYADLAQVKSVIDPACAKHGIGYVQHQSGGTLFTRVLDAGTGEALVEDSREVGKGKDQERGSSETYQRRYALLTVFGLAPEDDDGRAAQAGGAELARAKKALWEAVGRDKAAADAMCGPEHPETPEWYEAAARCWKAFSANARDHGGDPIVMAEGSRKRPDYEESAAFWCKVASEFEAGR